MVEAVCGAAAGGPERRAKAAEFITSDDISDAYPLGSLGFPWVPRGIEQVRGIFGRAIEYAPRDSGTFIGEHFTSDALLHVVGFAAKMSRDLF